MDRRQKRTKKQIRQALIDLITEVGLKNITVSELSKRADINRGTFYLHYQDIHHLTESLEKELIEDLKQHALRLNPEAIMENQDSLYPLLVQIIQSFANHADLVSVLISPQGDPSFLITWEQIVAELILDKFNEVPERKQLSLPIPSDYLSTVIASLYTGVIIHWIETGMEKSVEEIATIISEGAILPIINQCSDK